MYGPTSLPPNPDYMQHMMIAQQQTVMAQMRHEMTEIRNQSTELANMIRNQAASRAGSR